MLNIYGRQSMAMAASIYNPSASFPAGGWAVLFLDAGQQIIRAALLPSVHAKLLLHEAWRASFIVAEIEGARQRDTGDGQPASARKERCWLQVDGAAVSDRPSLIAHRSSRTIMIAHGH